MNWKNRFKDSFPAGLVLGLITMVGFYLLINFIRLKMITYSDNPYLLKPPAVPLFTVAVNVLVFRYLMITLGKEQTGKGVLFITVISTFLYFLIYNRFINR